MALQTTPDELLKLSKEFVASVREYFIAQDRQHPELRVERVFAAAAAATGAVLVVLPFRTERHEKAAGLLFATAVRLWSQAEPGSPSRRGLSSAGSAARSAYSSPSSPRFAASGYGVVRDYEEEEFEDDDER